MLTVTISLLLTKRTLLGWIMVGLSLSIDVVTKIPALNKIAESKTAGHFN
jgi:hypothetical protein